MNDGEEGGRKPGEAGGRGEAVTVVVGEDGGGSRRPIVGVGKVVDFVIAPAREGGGVRGGGREEGTRLAEGVVFDREGREAILEVGDGAESIHAIGAELVIAEINEEVPYGFKGRIGEVRGIRGPGAEPGEVGKVQVFGLGAFVHKRIVHKEVEERTAGDGGEGGAHTDLGWGYLGRQR